MSAVVHSAHPASTARTLTEEITGHAREQIEKSEMGDSARQLHEAKLAERGTAAHRLSAALMVLRSAIGRLPQQEERDRLNGHYATELAREATQIRR